MEFLVNGGWYLVGAAITLASLIVIWVILYRRDEFGGWDGGAGLLVAAAILVVSTIWPLFIALVAYCVLMHYGNKYKLWRL